jgi:hypothetical protein
MIRVGVLSSFGTSRTHGSSCNFLLEPLQDHVRRGAALGAEVLVHAQDMGAQAGDIPDQRHHVFIALVALADGVQVFLGQLRAAGERLIGEFGHDGCCCSAGVQHDPSAIL